MPGTIRESLDLVFDGRAVPGSDAFYLTAEKGGSSEIPSYYFVCFFICVCEPAGDLLAVQCIVHKRKRHHFLISVLPDHFAVVKSRTEGSCGSSGLEASEFDPYRSQRIRQSPRRGKSVRSARIGAVAYEYLSAKKSTRRDHESAARIVGMCTCEDAFYPAVFHIYLYYFILPDVEIWLFFKRFLHLGMIGLFVRLGSE